MADYPEHAKMKACQRESQTIGEFLDWLQGGGLNSPAGGRHSFLDLGCPEGCPGNHPREYYIRDRDGDSVPLNIEKILQTYFEIDAAKLEAERLAMLEAQRALNELGRG
jgi:hypothetical protein